MKRFSLWMLGIAAMLASCSQNDILQDTSETSTLTVTASLAGGIGTRSAVTDQELSALTRCKLLVFKSGETTNPVKELDGTRSGNNFIFTMRLEPDIPYDFYCWADGGKDVYDWSSDGTISFTLFFAKELGIAQRGVKTNVIPEKNGNLSMNLVNAVAKVELATTGAFTQFSTVIVTVQSCTKYNLLTGKATEPGKLEVWRGIPTAPDASESNPQSLFSFYVMANDDDQNQTITINYENRNICAVPNVPIKPDCRTLLKGDVTTCDTQVLVTATIDENWQDAPQHMGPNTHIITLSNENPLSADALTKAAGDDTRLIIHGPMTSADFTTLTDWLNAQTQNYDLTLQDVTTLEANAFSRCTHLRALKLPNVVSVGENSLALFNEGANLEELWITAKGNLDITGKAMGTNITPFENVTLYLNQDKKSGGTGSPTTSYGAPYVWELGEVDCYFKGFVFLDDEGNIVI